MPFVYLKGSHDEKRSEKTMKQVRHLCVNCPLKQIAVEKEKSETSWTFFFLILWILYLSTFNDSSLSSMIIPIKI